MSSSERREREREALRQTILDAARELLTAEGSEKLSMRRIAEKINYSATAIYLHFKDREALMDALAAEGFALLVDRMERQAAEAPAEHLHRIGADYVEFALSHRPLYALMFQVGSSPQERYGAYNTRQAAATRSFKILAETIRQLAKAEHAPLPEEPDAATLAAGVFWAHLHGAVALIITGHGRFFADQQPEFCRQAVETAVAGLRARLTSTVNTATDFNTNPERTTL